MKTTKKFLSIFLALLMIISIIPMSSITASAASGIQAKIDELRAVYYTGIYFTKSGGPCYDYGGADCALSNIPSRGGLPAGSTVSNAIGNGWSCNGFARYAFYYVFGKAFGTSTVVSKPSLGDIIETSSSYGTHYSMYLGEDANNYYVYDSNGALNATTKQPDCSVRYYGALSKSKNSLVKVYHASNYDSVNGSTPTPDINYATNLAGNCYLQNKGSGDWLSVSENKNASTQPINTWGTWYKEFRVNLTASGSGYKMKFPEISSLLVNPYSYTPTVGTKINIYQDENDITQWWGFEKVGDAYAIRCLYNPSLVLTDNGVNQATLTTYTGASNQLWYLHPYTYSVSYNANGGSGAPSSQTKYFNESLTLSSTKPTRSGYTFLGWSTSSTATSASYSASSSFTTNANTTLYAVWKEEVKTYTISYDANGGSGAPASQTKEQYVALELSKLVPTRFGYTFLGWSESSTAISATFQPGSYFYGNANTTLYAVWKANTYTISYNANGGIGAPASQTKTHDITLTLSNTVPTRAGYKFLGWSTSSSATSATYTAGGSFTSNANTTLYAVWQKDIVEPKVHVSSTSVNLTLGGTESAVIYAWGTDVTGSYTVQYQIADTNIVSCAWGDWNSENKAPLTITAKAKGTTTVTVSVIDYETREILDSIVVTVNVGVSSSYIDFSIKEPSTTTIRHNDGIILHLNADGNIPDGARIHWSADNNNFDGGYSEDGMQCLLISKNNGYTVITATLYDADDNVIATDSIEMRSKAGFFDKIGGFFRSLFGATKIYDN